MSLAAASMNGQAMNERALRADARQESLGFLALCSPGVILVGVIIVLPMILGYTIYSYFIFRGKARDLTYY